MMASNAPSRARSSQSFIKAGIALLLLAGATVGAVRRWDIDLFFVAMEHGPPRITPVVLGPLVPYYIRASIQRLRAPIETAEEHSHAEAIAVIRRMLASDNYLVQSQAAYALREYPAEERAAALPELLHVLETRQDFGFGDLLDCVTDLGDAGAPAVERLRPLLHKGFDRRLLSKGQGWRTDMNDARRSVAIRMLRGIGPAALPAAPDLTEAVRSCDWVEAEEAFLVLQRLDRAAATSLAEELVHDPDSRVRKSMLLALDRLAPDSAAAAAKDLLNDRNEETRAAAEDILKRR